MPAYDQIPSLAQQGLVAGWQTGEREQALIDQERARQFEQDVRLQSLDLARQQTRRAQEELVRKVQAEKDQQSTDALFYKIGKEGGDPRELPNYGELLAKASPDAYRYVMGDVHTRKERDETVMDIEKLRAMAPGMVRMVLSDPKNKPLYDKVQKHRIDLKDEERPLSDLEQEKMKEAMFFTSKFDQGAANGYFTEAEREQWSPARKDIRVFMDEFNRREAALQAKSKAYAEQQAAAQKQQQTQTHQAHIGQLIQKKRAGVALTPQEEGMLVTTPGVSEYETKQPQAMSPFAFADDQTKLLDTEIGRIEQELLNQGVATKDKGAFLLNKDKVKEGDGKNMVFEDDPPTPEYTRRQELLAQRDRLLKHREALGMAQIQKSIGPVIQQLTAQLGRKPTSAEVRAALGAPPSSQSTQGPMQP